MKSFRKLSEFYHKKSRLEYHLQRNILKGGTAYIPCRIEGLSDIVSKFSVEGVASLDAEFVDYFVQFVDCIPEEYPVVLEIHGPKFTEETKKWISELIAE